MSYEKAPKYNFEYLNLAEFELIELFGGQPQDLLDSDSLKQYQQERLVQVETGAPTFIVDGFFGEGFRMSYFVEGSRVAQILCDKRYFIDEQDQDAVENQNIDASTPSAYAVLVNDLDDTTEEMSLRRAIKTVKDIGYPSYA